MLKRLAHVGSKSVDVYSNYIRSSVALTLSVIETGLVGPDVLLSVLVRSGTLPVGLARGPLALVSQSLRSIVRTHTRGQGHRIYKIMSALRAWRTSGQRMPPSDTKKNSFGSETWKRGPKHNKVPLPGVSQTTWTCDLRHEARTDSPRKFLHWSSAFSRSRASCP